VAPLRPTRTRHKKHWYAYINGSWQGIAEGLPEYAPPVQSLARMKCVACNRDAPTVSDSDLAELHPQVDKWEVVELDGIKRLTRTYPFGDFAQALAFTEKVGRLAEEEGHHPALLTEWGRTTVTWWTHKIKGLHRNDFIMAAKTDELYRT